MTPERLAEIRERAEWASLGPAASRELLAHVDHLAAENAQLRARTEAIAYALRPALPAAEVGPLNPPTEGETDDLRTV